MDKKIQRESERAWQVGSSMVLAEVTRQVKDAFLFFVHATWLCQNLEGGTVEDKVGRYLLYLVSYLLFWEPQNPLIQ